MQLQAFTFGPSLSLRVIERDGDPSIQGDALGCLGSHRASVIQCLESY